MTTYRWLVVLAWMSWMAALLSLTEIFNVWIRVLAAIASGLGFGELWRAQRRIPKILEKTER